jgi:hypothetical protein
VAVARCRSLDNQPVQVMAVADGHGGERYRFSDVGSTLACEQALMAVEHHLRHTALLAADAPDLEGWARWLGADLPERIHGNWLAAVREHWHRQGHQVQADHPEATTSEAEVPLLYGSTVGLVVMAPRWWGYTGLGDWDLVRVVADGRGQLLSDEGDTGGGEATGSLCSAWAPQVFRSGLEPIHRGDAAFGLLLSTDGIRKSCVSDRDFLMLARHLLATPARGAGEALAASLEQITREGSGDDVSVAMALHGTLAGIGSLPSLPCPAPQGTVAQARVAPDPAAREAAQESPPPPRRPGTPLVGLALVLASAGLGLGWLWLRHRTVAPPTPVALRQQIDGLCRGPVEAIGGTLSGRRSQFDGLRQGRLKAPSMLAAAHRDPLGALIASSFDPATGAMVQGKAVEALGLCPPLATALRQQWQGGLRPPPSVSLPATAPKNATQAPTR